MGEGVGAEGRAQPPELFISGVVDVPFVPGCRCHVTLLDVLVLLFWVLFFMIATIVLEQGSKL